MMKIIDARWTPKYNEIQLRCDHCGFIFWARADRVRVKCKSCGALDNMHLIKQQ